MKRFASSIIGAATLLSLATPALAFNPFEKYGIAEGVSILFTVDACNTRVVDSESGDVIRNPFTTACKYIESVPRLLSTKDLCQRKIRVVQLDPRENLTPALRAEMCL